VKITLESTTKIVYLNGVPARIWEGRTDGGVPLHAYVTRVAVDPKHDCAEFHHDLREHRAPSVEVAALPIRLVL
jgi:hypothetical protein